MTQQTLEVQLGVNRVGVNFVRIGTETRPPSLGHNQRNILVTGDGHGANDGVDHHVEEVPVPDSGGEVVTEAERVLLKQGKPDWNLAADFVEFVRVDIDQERRIGVAEELEQGSDDGVQGGL